MGIVLPLFDGLKRNMQSRPYKIHMKSMLIGKLPKVLRKYCERFRGEV